MVSLEDEEFGVTNSSWLCCAERTPWEAELLQVRHAASENKS